MKQLSETMLKPTEDLKKNQNIEKKYAKFKVIGENCKFFFFGKKLQKSQVLVNFFVASDLIVEHLCYITGGE